MTSDNRFLITTADERSWKFDQPVLFLGEWCRVYERKKTWKDMDAIVAKPYVLTSEQKEHNRIYVQTLSKQLLGELTNVLNEFHKTNHNLRYWNIILGHWLQRSVAVIFNRFFTLQTALKAYKVAASKVLDSSNYTLTTPDSFSFIWACNDDTWNHVLYSKILKFCGNVNLEIDDKSLRGIHGFNCESKTIDSKSLKQHFFQEVNNVLQIFSKKEDAFIVKTYLPRKVSIKLQLAFNQCPQFWQSPKVVASTPDANQRRLIKLDAEQYDGFERYVRLQLPELIPTCYLEGYNNLLQQVMSLPWPKKPRFIFTSNSFDTDEIFKTWTATKVEEGIPYFVGQHGNNYGTLLGSQHWPELVTCDKFITWGWTNKKVKNVPAYIFKNANLKLNEYDPKGGLLLIEVSMPHRLTIWDSYFEFGIYLEEQFRFVKTLSEIIQKQLTVRLHHEYAKHTWSESERWRVCCPGIRVENGTMRIKNMIKKSRLVIHSYDSTGILETLSSNVPTMCFWHGELDHLLPSAKPYYDLLKKAGILAYTPEEAAESINMCWENLNAWWESTKVQDARKEFCEEFAKIDNRPIRTLKRILTEKPACRINKEGLKTSHVI